MADIGPRWGAATSANVKLMVAEFTRVHESVAKTGVNEMRDLEYGPHPRQRLDVYSPAVPGRMRAAVVFVHGGAFTEGDRNRSGEIYGNIGRYFARHGIIGVNIGYRLAPEIRYPQGSRDVGIAVEWTRRHAPELGIDPARIFLIGHSAGAAHAATYAYERRLHPADGAGIAGLIVISGRVRADNLPENPNAARVEAYYGKDASVYDRSSPVSHVDADSVPTLVAWSEFENPLLDIYCPELVHRLAAAKRRSPPVVWLKGHNHTSAIAHIGLDEDMLGGAIREFIANPA
ncbi:MAG: alpha/beta hydrolase [Bryobacteraceae bacterium]